VQQCLDTCARGNAWCCALRNIVEGEHRFLGRDDCSRASANGPACFIRTVQGVGVGAVVGRRPSVREITRSTSGFPGSRILGYQSGEIIICTASSSAGSSS